MRFSVLIPAYNAATTIGATLDAALSQSVRPHEILVYDDGSSDDTQAILSSYGARIRAFSGPNRGVAHARNVLCERATGDQIVFLDADDIWHPRYLEVQQQLIERHPDAIAYFTDHVDVVGSEPFAWDDHSVGDTGASELIAPNDFLRRYNHTPMRFGMSWFCMPTDALRRLGKEPFYAGGAEDAYVHNLLPLLGPVAQTSARLVAYRILDGSLSSDRLHSAMMVVDSFRELAPRYDSVPRKLSRSFGAVTASRKRDCGKFLMGAGRYTEARSQFIDSISDSARPSSLLKSLCLLALTLVPRPLQPRWPSLQRLG
jgi:glycosyltransferase involved in cell wall biosynthesis